MIALGIIAALLTALFATRVGMRVSYDTSGLRLWIIFGLIKKEIKMEEPEEKPDAGQTESAAVAEKPPEEKKTSLLDSFDKKKLVLLAFRAVPRVLRLPRIDILELHYVAGGETADITAVRYGKMCAALGAGLPFLHNGLRVKKQVITTNLDYTRVKQEISGKIQVTLTIGAAFAFGVWALLELVKCRGVKGE